MVDFVMPKVMIVKSAANGSELRDGQQAVMAKRVAQAPTLQASLDRQETITDVTAEIVMYVQEHSCKVKGLRAL